MSNQVVAIAKALTGALHDHTSSAKDGHVRLRWMM
jgi:hypothetical protein